MFVNDKETFKRIAFIACHVIKTNDYQIPPNLAKDCNKIFKTFLSNNILEKRN